MFKEIKDRIIRMNKEQNIETDQADLKINTF